MAGEGVSEILLRYKVDRASMNQTVTANNVVKGSIASVGTEAEQASVQIRAAFQTTATTRLSSAMRTATADIRKAGDEADDLRESLQGAARDAQNIRVPDGGGNASGVTRVTRADATDTAFGRASSIVSALPGGSELANVTGLVSDVAAGFRELPDVLENTELSLTQLLTIGGGAGIVLGGLAVVLSLVSSASEQARQAEQRRIELIVEGASRQAELNSLIEEGNVQQIQSLIAQSQQEFEAAQLAFNDLQQRSVELEEQRQAAIANAGEGASLEVIRLEAALNENAAAQAAQVQAMEDSQAALTDYTAALGPASENMADTSQSAQELAAAANEAALELQRATQTILNGVQQRVNAEVEYARLSATATEEQIQARIAENNLRVELLRQEQAELQALADAGDQAAQQALPELTQQIERLEADTTRLSGSILESAQANDQAAEAEREAAEASRASEQAARQRAQTLSQIANIERQLSEQAAADARTDARAARDLRRQRLLEDIDFQRELAQKEKDFHKSIIDLINDEKEVDTEAREDKIDAEKEFSERELVRVENLEDKLADIRNRANREIGEGAGELDAKRVQAALLAKEEELANAVKENDKQKDENQKARDDRLAAIEAERQEQQSALAQRIADLRASYEEQRTADIDAFNERRQREDEERAIRRQDEIEDRNLRRQALQSQLDDLKSQLNQEKNIRKSGFNAVLSDWQNLINSMKNVAKAGASSANKPPPGGKALPPAATVNPGGTPGGGGTGGFGDKKGIKGYALGGKPPVNQVVVVGERGPEPVVFSSPATVYPNSAMTTLGGARTTNVTFNIYGATDPQAVAAVVRTEMREVIAGL